MRIIDPREIKNRRAARKHKAHVRRSFIFVVVIVMLGTYVYLAFQRPLPQAQAVVLSGLGTKPATPSLAWPAYGQASVAAPAYGLLAASPAQKSAPIASVAKVMTALAVLKQKPIAAGQQGATLTMTDNDVALYAYYQNNDGSNVMVASGEQMSEYQALQALLLPSANNMADSLATWAFGSMDAYLAYANNMAKGMGMSNTHLADASGFSAQTVSSASDLAALGLAALQQPVLMEIASQSQATIPVAGVIHNVNMLLGQDGIIGIKTGNTDQAGGCYLVAATHSFDEAHKLTLVAVVMGAPTLNTAMSASVALLNSAYKGFALSTIVHSGEVVATYTFPWGKKANITVNKDVPLFGWSGKAIEPKVSLNPINVSSAKGAVVGMVSASSATERANAQAVLQTSPPQPPIWWRLTHF